MLPGPVSQFSKTLNEIESPIAIDDLINFDPESVRPMKNSGPPHQDLGLQKEGQMRQNEDITCTFVCERNGACSHKTVIQTTHQGSMESGMCVRRGETKLIQKRKNTVQVGNGYPAY